MIKIMFNKWGANRDKLLATLKETPELNGYSYKDLVKLTFDVIFNDDESGEKLNTDRITQIDDGDYQGTLLYLIPFDTYQPSDNEYLMTSVWYGSCSGCDSLLNIQDCLWDGVNHVNEKQLAEYMKLCQDIVNSTIKPYNYGWRASVDYEPVEF